MDNTSFPDYTEGQEQTLDIKALFFKFLSYWYLFLITLLLAMLVAYLFNKYTKPVYQIKSTILIQEGKGGGIEWRSVIIRVW